MRRTITLSLLALGLCLGLSVLFTTASAQSGDTGKDVPDVEGIWAQKLVTTGVTNAPVVGKVTSQTVTYQRMAIEQSGTDLAITEKTCDVNINSDQSAIKTIVSNRFVNAIEPVERTAELRERDDGYYFFAPKKIKTLGVRLEDEQAKLPRDKDDPRVIDQDNDGNPGMTVEVDGVLNGDLYMIQRSWDELWGKVMQNGRIAGRTTWSTNQIVLEKTGTVFGDVDTAKPHPNKKLSYFRMAPVSDDTSCADIAKRGDALFD